MKFHIIERFGHKIVIGKPTHTRDKRDFIDDLQQMPPEQTPVMIQMLLAYNTKMSKYFFLSHPCSCF
jgi:hypothetical protein